MTALSTLWVTFSILNLWPVLNLVYLLLLNLGELVIVAYILWHRLTNLIMVIPTFFVERDEGNRLIELCDCLWVLNVDELVCLDLAWIRLEAFRTWLGLLLLLELYIIVANLTIWIVMFNWFLKIWFLLWLLSCTYQICSIWKTIISEEKLVCMFDLIFLPVSLVWVYHKWFLF